MDFQNFLTLRVGEFVFVAINSGTTGVSKYQYVGVFECHETKERKHVFLSPHFVSTVTILEGREINSIALKNIFFTETEAKERAKNIY